MKDLRDLNRAVVGGRGSADHGGAEDPREPLGRDRQAGPPPPLLSEIAAECGSSDLLCAAWFDAANRGAATRLDKYLR